MTPTPQCLIHRTIKTLSLKRNARHELELAVALISEGHAEHIGQKNAVVQIGAAMPVSEGGDNTPSTFRIYFNSTAPLDNIRWQPSLCCYLQIDMRINELATTRLSS